MDQIDTTQLVDAISAKNWYLLAAILVGAVVYGWRMLAPALWKKIPDGYRWLPPVVISGLLGFSEAFYIGKDWPYAIAQMLGCAVWAGLLAMGGHGGAVEAPIPYGGGAGGNAKVIEKAIEIARLAAAASGKNVQAPPKE